MTNEQPSSVDTKAACTLAPPGEYDWTVHMPRRCGLAAEGTNERGHLTSGETRSRRAVAFSPVPPANIHTRMHQFNSYSPVFRNLKPRLHDTTCCQTGCTTVWQPAVSCI